MQTATAPDRRRTSANRTWEYRTIFLASYPIMLVGEVVELLLRAFARRPSSPASRKSIIGSAREGAHSAAMHAFLG